MGPSSLRWGRTGSRALSMPDAMRARQGRPVESARGPLSSPPLGPTDWPPGLCPYPPRVGRAVRYTRVSVTASPALTVVTPLGEATPIEGTSRGRASFALGAHRYVRGSGSGGGGCGGGSTPPPAFPACGRSCAARFELQRPAVALPDRPRRRSMGRDPAPHGSCAYDVEGRAGGTSCETSRDAPPAVAAARRRIPARPDCGRFPCRARRNPASLRGLRYFQCVPA